MQRPRLARAAAFAALLALIFGLVLTPPARAQEPVARSPENDAAANEIISPLELLSHIDAARVQHDLGSLAVCLDLSEVAKAHAEEMIEKDYFSHRSPETGTPGARVRRAGLSYRSVSENLAGNSQVEAAHRMLMESPPHRANLLSTSHEVVGVAAVRGGRYGMMIVQMFAADKRRIDQVSGGETARPDDRRFPASYIIPVN